MDVALSFSRRENGCKLRQLSINDFVQRRAFLARGSLA